LLKHFEEFGRYVAFAGFKNVKIADVEGFLETVKKHLAKNMEAQFFDAELVATWQHLYFAVLNALNAFKSGINISKSLAVEMLLYASAQRQIRKAMELLGIKPHTKSIALVIIGEKADDVKATLQVLSKAVGGERDDTVLEISRGKMQIIRKVFDISDVELEAVMKGNNMKQALIDLIIERMALLATEH
jgi:KEOPS complex subunit Cgi121